MIAANAVSVRPLDTRAWLVWVASALIVGLTTLNPWYALTLIGVVVLLWQGAGSGGGLLRLGALFRLALVALVIGAIFNALVVRQGDTTLLRLPDWLPILGGRWTVEALVFGALNALRFVSLIFAFALFSRAVNFADLLRLAPPALFELGLVVSIGFSLAPSMLRAFSEIREAQALRGHEGRGVRDLLPLFTPLVVSGMERALALAEAMEARGYGGGQPISRQSAARGLIGLGGLLAPLTLYAFAPSPIWLGVAALAGLSLVGMLRRMSVGRTRLRRGHWGLPEWVVSAGAALAGLIILSANPATLVYDAYRLSVAGLPPFNPWIGAALLGLALPGLFMMTGGDI